VAPGTGLADFYAARAHWVACRSDAAVADFTDLTGFQCAAVRVPLDYRHPAGRKISIGIARLPASGSHRIGSLLINPGGPGVSGLSYLRVARSAIPAAVRARFDIVGFDPRGVGVSAGLNCLSVAQFDAAVAAPVAPTTPAEAGAAVARAKLLADGCAKTAGWELPYLGTVYSARDIDLIRSAVGDAKLSYLGKSYGTQLGAVYASEFPTKVRALVLDGALPVGLPVPLQSREQGQGFEGDLRDFLADCLHHAGCPFSGTAAHARTQLDAFLAAVAVHPLPTALGRPLQVGNAVNGITYELYDTSAWPALRSGLNLALRGDGSALLAYSDQFAGRRPSRYSGVASAFPAIQCMDEPSTYSVDQVSAYAKSWAVSAPLFGPLEAWGLLTCTGWTKTRTPLPATLRATGAPPIVVVGSTGDPATPYQWAARLAHQLPGSREISYVGDGHTVYGDGRSSCVDSAVNAYLIELSLPKAGLRCH
jgi:pimeloyl-ACP methyl ester carboxylesterase